MSTRSYIGIKTGEDKGEFVYCHFDGYPEGVGKTLLENYTNEHKIRYLISLGDMSSLDEFIETDMPHSFENPRKGVCVFYNRDRGENDCESRTYRLSNIAQEAMENGIEYVYCYDTESKKWNFIDVWDNKKWEDLKEFLEEIA